MSRAERAKNLKLQLRVSRNRRERSERKIELDIFSTVVDVVGLSGNPRERSERKILSIQLNPLTVENSEGKERKKYETPLTRFL